MLRKLQNSLASKKGVHRKIKIKKCPVNPRFTGLPKG
jgi:hypothetical protein